MKNDDSWKVLNNIHEWIRVADAKAGALLAAGGVLGGIILARMPVPHHKSGVDAVFWVLLLALLLVTASTLCALLCIAPILKRKHAPNSLIYFGHIARKYKENASGFHKAFSDLLKKGFNGQLTEQIWTTSLIAEKKFNYVEMGIKLFIAALLVTGIAVFMKRAS